MFEKGKKYYDAIKKWFWALPVWKRAIVSSLIGAIGGSSIIGFFNRYALYYHAICQDFRLPIEGVEYIDLAITLVSFAFVFISIIGSIIIYSFLGLLAVFFSRFLVNPKDSVKLNRWKRVFTIIQVFAAMIPAASIFFIQLYKLESGNSILFNNPIVFLTIGIVVTILVFGYVFSKSESSRKMFTLVGVLILILLITSSLFNQSVYKYFLKNIQYGGEIPIEIEYRKADNTEAKLKGLLLIRTSRSLILENVGSKNISEVPMERVSKIMFLKE